MFDKDFDIYNKRLVNGVYYSKNFSNQDKLSKSGKMVYNAFQTMRKTSGEGFQNMNEDFYFDNIDQIRITSQQRKPEDDKYPNSHTRDMAVDFWIKPIWLMPYYAGRLFRMYGNNIFISVENGHIHFDIDLDKGKGYKFNKSVMVETENTKVDGKIFPVQEKINQVLSFYGVSTLSIQRKAAGIEEETRKMLLDTTAIKLYIGNAQSALDMKIEKAVEENPVLNAIGRGIDLLDKNRQAVITGFVVLILVIIAMKYLPNQIQDAMMQKLREISTK
jgi:hypothetical protein